LAPGVPADEDRKGGRMDEPLRILEISDYL